MDDASRRTYAENTVINGSVRPKRYSFSFFLMLLFAACLVFTGFTEYKAESAAVSQEDLQQMYRKAQENSKAAVSFSIPAGFYQEDQMDLTDGPQAGRQYLPARTAVGTGGLFAGICRNGRKRRISKAGPSAVRQLQPESGGQIREAVRPEGIRQKEQNHRIYINNQDWPNNNQKLYAYFPKDGAYEEGTVRDGRWRWLPHDMDVLEASLPPLEE